MKKFIIYLDIDGPLVSFLNLKQRDVIDGKHIFTRSSVETLNKIIELFDADICIISTWGRKYHKSNNKTVSGDDVKEFKDFLIGRGIKVNSLSIGDCDHRAEYILERKVEGYDRYLIIDDECYEYYKRLGEIPYNRILKVNSWRTLDNNDYIYCLRNTSRLNSKEY